jgi:MFS family permease
MSLSKETRVVVSVSALSVGFAMYSITNVLIAYIINSYSSHAPMTVSQLLTLPSISGLIAAFAAGPLALKINKKVLLLINSIAILAAFLMFIFVGGNGPLGLLFAAAIIAGVAQGSNMTFISSIINEYFDTAKSATYLALTTALTQGGVALASFVAGYLGAGNNGANWPYGFTVGLYFVPAILVFAFLMPGKKDSTPAAAQRTQTASTAETSEPAAAESNKIPARVFLMILMLMFFTLCMFSFGLNISTYIIIEYNLGTSAQTGMVNSLFMVVGMVVGFTYALWQKFLKKYIGTVGIALLMIGIFAMMQLNTTLAGAFIAAVLVGLGHSLAYVFIMAKIMENTPKKMVPVSISLSMGGVNIVVFVSLYILNFVGGLFGGGLYNNLLAGCLFGVIATIMSVFLLLPEKKGS